LANWTTTGFRCIGFLKGLNLVENEFIDIRHKTARALKHTQRSSVATVTQNRRISTFHLLIAPLALTRVMEATVFLPTVDVPVLLAGGSVRENKNVRRRRRRPDSALPAPSKRGVNHLPFYELTRGESPNGHPNLPFQKYIRNVYSGLMKGSALRLIRRRLGLSQRAFAEVIGVAANTVARWERDELGMSETAKRLIEVIGGPPPTRKRKGGG
jgi:DNA-binding transcriptional regulator YiaG